jgi:8-oxo-dGTP pyrophosphatase MutT (NUDIX family)
MPVEESPTILAAGGAVVRGNPQQGYEVVLVHRPKYDDWSWPKGKCDPNESLTDCAIREVQEETGILTEVGPVLCELTYPDPLDRPKRVTYFFLSIITIDDHPADDEIDELAWVSLDEVDRRLTNPADAEVTQALRRYLDRLPNPQ